MNNRTKTVRKAIMKGDIAYIPLGGKLGGYAIVDAEYAWVDKHLWSRDKTGYPAANINKQRITLHKFLYGIEKGLVNDHINRNKLDNRKINIRKVTQQENTRNSSVKKTNKSGYKGVQWYSVRNKWRAYIWINYKMKTLGYYLKKEDAIEARRLAEIEYWN